MTNQGNPGLCEEARRLHAPHQPKRQQLHITEDFTSDEKTAVQALDRTQPVLPLLPGTPERMSHDYKRHGTIDLYAALNLASGVVTHQLTARHRAIEFQKFLNLIDRTVPAGLAVHVVLDNSSTHKTPAIQRWLVRHPRFEFHFTPTSSSWMNLVWVNRPWEARPAVAV